MIVNKLLKSSFFSLFVLSTLLLTSCGTSSNQDEMDEEVIDVSPANHQLKMADQLDFEVIADSLGKARHVAVRENGDLFVALRELKDGKGIVALRDTNGDGSYDQMERFGDMPGTGIKVYKDYLYFGADTTVVRYAFDGDELLPKEEYEVIVGGFPVQDQHATKPFTFDKKGNIYITVGAPSNACMEKTRTPGSPGQDPCPQLELHAGIFKFDAEKINQVHGKDHHRYAAGIRNAVALHWNQHQDQLYALQHGRDQLSQFFPDMYGDEENAELPAEEFLKIEDGDNFGWPYCYFDPFQDLKVLAPEFGGDGKMQSRCKDMKDPIMAFPAHWAPNDLLFYDGDLLPARFKNGALVAFHGSWNRAPLKQAGYFVAFVPFDEAGNPAGDWEVFAENFAGDERISSPNDALYRPMGLVQAPDGSVIITDSVLGRVWRIRALKEKA